ncbi:FRG domain-containing protein [Sphingomonas profundi]|uniref:FRG domain-containing protein n=1 Tax=Alterirhizorhabdus profundi TaxID=2681549 RepID=UPI001E3FF6AA
MQHFGSPTRLMDVSQNPLVALCFATDPGPEGEESDGAFTAFAIPEAREKYFDSDSMSCLPNLANMTAIEKDRIIRLRQLRLKGTTKKAEIDRFNNTNAYKRLHQSIMIEITYFVQI